MHQFGSKDLLKKSNTYMQTYFYKGNNQQNKNKWSLWMETVLYKYKECCLVGCLVINLIITTVMCSKRNYKEGRIFIYIFY